MHEKTSNRKAIVATILLVALAAIIFFIYRNNKPDAVVGSKEVTIEVIIPDEQSKEYVLHTDALNLKDALDEEGLIDGADSGFGFFITEVDNRVADASKQEWWCITKDGEDVLVGVTDIVIEDGDKFELTLMVGY